jgi:hypothetical protein
VSVDISHLSQKALNFHPTWLLNRNGTLVALGTCGIRNPISVARRRGSVCPDESTLRAARGGPFNSNPGVTSQCAP